MASVDFMKDQRQRSRGTAGLGDVVALFDHAPWLREELAGFHFIMRVLFAIAGPLLVGMVGYNILEACYVEASLLVAMEAALLVYFWTLHKAKAKQSLSPEKEYRLGRNVIRVFLLIFLTYISLSAGWKSELDRVQWSYIFPMLAFLCLDRSEGLCWTALFFASLLAILLYPQVGAAAPDAFLGFKVRYLLSFSVMCGIAFAGKYGIDRIYSRLAREREQSAASERGYRKAYEGLLKESEQRRHTEQALAESEGEGKGSTFRFEIPISGGGAPASSR